MKNHRPQVDSVTCFNIGQSQGLDGMNAWRQRQEVHPHRLAS